MKSLEPLVAEGLREDHTASLEISILILASMRRLLKIIRRVLKSGKPMVTRKEREPPTTI